MNLVLSWTQGFVERWFFREVFVTVGKNAKKRGLLEILTADVGGCTLMDADEFSFVLDIWVRRYRAKKWEKTRFMKVLNRRFSG
jgi:hypothetical protein